MTEAGEQALLDVAIVGGGPAGQAAALALLPFHPRLAVLDEQPRPGGQIGRQPPATFRVPGWLSGRPYAGVRDQLARFAAAGIDWRGGCAVLGLQREDRHFRLTVADAAGVRGLHARQVLIATGCQDLAVPLPGWTLPGVMAAGGIQAFIKSQQLVPGTRVALFGTHPLMLVVAEQIVAAGGVVAMVAFAQPRASLLATLWRHVRAATTCPGPLAQGAATLARLMRAGVPVRFGAPVAALEGAGQLERLRLSDGTAVACDVAGMCYGFVPQSTLPRLAGAAMRPCWGGGQAAIAGPCMESSIPGLFVAGETTGVAGAAAAAVGGTLAGLGIARQLGWLDAAEMQHQARPLQARLRRLHGFAALLEALADPGDHWPPMAPDTLVCRCEDVTLAALDRAIVVAGPSANAVKLVTRCGMGLCQGRNCEPTLLRLLAARGDASLPGFTPRFPARPVPIGDLLG